MASANDNHASIPFWDSAHPLATNRATDPGTGVDHIQSGPQFPTGFPFHEAGPWGMWRGPGGHRGRRGGWGGPWGGRFRGWYDNGNDMAHEGGDNDSEDGPDTPGPSPPPPHHGGEHPPPPPCPPGAGHPFPHHRGFGRRFGRGRGGPCGRGGSRHHGPPPPYQGAWDFRPMMHAFAQHPLAQALRHYFEQEQAEDEAFTPPVDVFNRPSEWQLHVALPGAKKEDVGVSWDSDKKMLEIAGVVYRPGDEEFLQSLSVGERKVGMFSRTVKLPPEGSDEKDEVDGDNISAKIEDGILIVTVPKVEREWTEIKKVDIQ